MAIAFTEIVVALIWFFLKRTAC